MLGGVVLLNKIGDVKICWDNDDEKIRQFIQNKLNQGYSFFVFSEDIFNMYPEKSKITKSSDIKDKAVIMDDKEAEKLAADGLLNIVSIKGQKIANFDTAKVSQNIEEIMKSSSVAVRPIHGG